MNLIFKDPKTLQRMHEGPLRPCMDSYAADRYKQGYARPSAQVQIRLVADFSRWLAKQRITPQEITIENSQRYLRSEHRHKIGDVKPLVSGNCGERPAPRRIGWPSFSLVRY